jgi:hypothetical protein
MIFYLFYNVQIVSKKLSNTISFELSNELSIESRLRIVIYSCFYLKNFSLPFFKIFFNKKTKDIKANFFMLNNKIL